MKITPLILFCLCTLSLTAQIDKTERLTQFIEQTLAATDHLTGLSVAITNPEGTLYAKGFGYADRAQQEMVTPKTSFYIASCTKAYNGLLASILAAEGQLELSRPISSYRPFSSFERQDLFAGITVMDLLTHQSGLDNPYLSTLLAYSGEYTDAQVLRLIEEETQANETGKAFAYTNFGYYLLDVLLQAELGKSWRDLLQEKVFGPLDMEHTTAYASKVSTPNKAVPFDGLYPDKLLPVYLRKVDATMHAAGGLMTTGEDAARFLACYLATEQGPFPTAAVRQSYEKQVSATHEFTEAFNADGYGLGWRTGAYAEQALVYHFGGYPGFFSSLSFIPEAGLGVAVLANNNISGALAIRITQYAYDLYLGNEGAVKKHERQAARQLKKQLRRYRKWESKHLSKMAKRTWQLTLPKAAYTGAFRNPHLGEVTIALEADELVARMGQIRTVATPYPHDNCARVEMAPGSGMVICFGVEDGKVVDFSFGRDVFERVE
ncbi:serine hydrolase domain-containing protein [Phaeodactylibacter xiamenensis]|uniref:serine hydrolase domain-containing protein n=1 Tax=Phaeodactylibacter xiamenensis TaxID=1524460 RepID=UPI003BAC8B84